jgi:hypothetical protein
MRATKWYAILTVLFLGIRAITPLAMDPGWDRPGTGWRSVLQLAICAILAAGLLAFQAVGVARYPLRPGNARSDWTGRFRSPR